MKNKLGSRFHKYGGIFFFFTILFSVAVSIAEAAPPSDEKISENKLIEIENYIKKEIENQHIPGAAAALVHKDRILYQKGFGVSGPSGREVTIHTPFLLGSTTKSFTALAVMQQVEKGRIDLDSSVQQYIPWFQLADSQSSSQITIRNLLYHTSGFPRIVGLRGVTSRSKSENALEKYVRSLSSVELSHPVGSKCEYSNVNYITLGLILEKITGLSYEEYIQKHIFDPLQMGHSCTFKRKARKEGIAVGHRMWFGYPKPALDMPYNRTLKPAL